MCDVFVVSAVRSMVLQCLSRIPTYPAVSRGLGGGGFRMLELHLTSNLDNLPGLCQPARPSNLQERFEKLRPSYLFVRSSLSSWG